MVVDIKKIFPIPGVEYLTAKRNIVIEDLNVNNSLYWMQALSSLYPEYAEEFKTVFISQTESGNPHIILGLGNYVSIKVSASKTLLKTNIYIQNKMLSEINEYVNVTHMPYKDIFNKLSEMMKTVQMQIPEEFADMSFLGGWMCETIHDELQEVAVFTLPKILIQGTENQFDVLSWSNDVILPTSETISYLEKAIQEEYRGTISYIPDQDTYMNNLNQILDQLGNKEFAKVVVTRKAVIQLEEMKSIIPLFSKINQKNYQEYSYFFKWNDEKEWFGVSPEVLLIKKGQKAISKPLAGTRKIAYGHKTEEEIIAELLHDNKENKEHQYAVSLMVNDLKELAVNKDVVISEDKHILKTPYAFHLKTHMYASLKKEVSTFDVLGSIYPPATIWGVPRLEVEPVLSEVEVFKREFFAGGFGYCRANDDSNFALTIRTAYLENGKLHVFAGGGIVEHSNPENEWKETRTKMTPFIRNIEITNETKGGSLHVGHL